MIVLALAIGGTTAIAAVGVIADPLSVFISFRETHYPMPFGTAERTSKAYAVRSRKPDALVLGTSRPAWGYSVERAPWTSMNAYNLSISAAHIYETRRLLEHAAAFAKPRLILLGLDQIMFRASATSSAYDRLNEGSLAVSPDGDRRFFPWQDLLGIALSVDLLWSSRPAVTQQATGTFSDSGLLVFNPRPTSRSVESLDKIYRDRLVSAVMQHESEHYGNFGFGYEMALRELRKMLEIARTNGAELALVINPVHASLLEALRQRGLLDDQDRWKKDVAATVFAFERETGYEVPIWDFNTVNRVTTEPVSRARLIDIYQDVTFFDPSHFFPKLGDQVQDKVFGLSGGSDSLGTRLRPDNIDRHLSAQWDLLARWAGENPEVTAWISDALEPR